MMWLTRRFTPVPRPGVRSLPRAAVLLARVEPVSVASYSSINPREGIVPRFHSNILNGGVDYDEMASIAEAKREARRYAAEMLADSVIASNPDDKWQIEVTDDQKLVLFSLRITMHDTPAREVR